MAEARDNTIDLVQPLAYEKSPACSTVARRWPLPGEPPRADSGAPRKSIARQSDDVHLDDELKHGGLVLFVRAATPDREGKALAIMRCHGADRVHVHKVELPKRVQDIPLADITPDPWLGPEKLGG